MPQLTQIKISAFRNLRSVELQPSNALNLIVGENGSGKTSLLESISVLAHGRSFRTHKFRRLINNAATGFTLFGTIRVGSDPLEKRLGISRNTRGQLNIRVDGSPVYSAAELATEFPLLVMNANSFQLLEGSSKYRRQFFDWLVFHVKHEFKTCWKSYVRCVKHRNSLLRSGKMSSTELMPWNRELCQLAVEITSMRQAVFTLFQEEFEQVFSDYSFDAGLTSTPALSFESGWKGEQTYEQQLEDHLERDKKLGYTSIGSHKSDLKIQCEKIPAVELLSRGQQKSVIVSLFMAEARVFSRLTGRKPVFLLDDLPSELDANNLSVVGQHLSQLKSQVFITAIDPDVITRCWPESTLADLKMFHVEHGDIQVAT